MTCYFLVDIISVDHKRHNGEQESKERIEIFASEFKKYERDCPELERIPEENSKKRKKKKQFKGKHRKKREMGLRNNELQFIKDEKNVVKVSLRFSFFLTQLYMQHHKLNPSHF